MFCRKLELGLQVESRPYVELDPQDEEPPMEVEIEFCVPCGPFGAGHRGAASAVERAGRPVAVELVWEGVAMRRYC